jgi:hypothetical protein
MFSTWVLSMKGFHLPLLLAGSLALAGCGSGQAAPAGAPVADPQAVAAQLQRASLIEGPQQITFGWALDEGGSRVRGRGVVRMVAPERLRLDLFGPRGETYLSAALVGDEFRIPGAATSAVPLPSAALLWATVGVVQPPADARLGAVSATEGEVVVRYAAGEDEAFEYRAAAEPMRLTSATRTGRNVRETLQLTRDAAGEVQEVRYRDLNAFRELVLTVESRAAVASFPASIWSPDGTAR